MTFITTCSVVIDWSVPRLCAMPASVKCGGLYRCTEHIKEWDER